MKYINFKRYKFSTIFKNINFRRYNFSRIYKSIDFRRYNFSRIYKSIDFRRYNFSRIYKSIDFRRYNFSRIYKSIDFRRYNFSRIYKSIDFRRYNFSKIYKYANLTRYRHILFYLVFFVFVSIFVYLSIPAFFNYDKLIIETRICKELRIECLIQGKIKYSFFPSPRLKLKNFVIKDVVDKKQNLGKIENVSIKLSIFKLLNKEKFDFTKIDLDNYDIYFDLTKFSEYKKFFTKKLNSKSIGLPINLNEGKIHFFEANNSIASIKDVNLKYSPNKNVDEATLKGNFAGDKIYISFENQKRKKNPQKIVILKLSNLNLYSKIKIINDDMDAKIVNGDLLFKKDKNRLTAVFAYKDDSIVVKHSNLRNSFLDGKLNGEINFLPYFNFNLNLDLSSINFNKLYSSLVSLDEENKKKLFKINKKINGHIALSADKIFSKHTLVRSLESQIKFNNGNIIFDQALFNLGKIGAADMTGIIKNEKKFSNFKFESNIFLDNLKRFYNKFGIYNKQTIPYDLFISGNFDLINLIMRLDEISGNNKFTEEDVAYIENEFNDLLLDDDYANLFNFLKFKEFIRLVATESN